MSCLLVILSFLTYILQVLYHISWYILFYHSSITWWRWLREDDCVPAETSFLNQATCSSEWVCEYRLQTVQKCSHSMWNMHTCWGQYMLLSECNKAVLKGTVSFLLQITQIITTDFDVTVIKCRHICLIHTPIFRCFRLYFSLQVATMFYSDILAKKR